MLNREPITLTAEAELEALKEMVSTTGWAVLQAHLAEAWGDTACLQKIDDALAREHVAPEDELAVTKRIRDTFKGVRAESTWTRMRIAELETALKRKKATPTIGDRFAGLRRGGSGSGWMR